MSTFTPGSLVRARKSDWVVEEVITDPDGARRLKVRAHGDASRDIKYLDPDLDSIEPLQAALPDIERHVGQEGGMLLRDALLLSTRRGAGPFRSLGSISVQPHAYQIVPLMMALAQRTTRLLIADGTGIGKTVEAGLIVRELVDRGDISRFCVITPPHLVDQWVTELRTKFNFEAEAVTRHTVKRLERRFVDGAIFANVPYTVVSLDYIKASNRVTEFVQRCPECVIVDEVHNCVSGSASQQRYNLLRQLAKNPSRHIIACSATPHAGDPKAFGRMLALLDNVFVDWQDMKESQRAALIPTLRKHIVQRDRDEIVGWEEGDKSLFPKRQSVDAPYALSASAQAFLAAAIAHCEARSKGAKTAEDKRRTVWGSMMLLGCIASSPGAAVSAMSKRSEHRDAQVTDPQVNVLDECDGDLIEPDDALPTAVTETKTPAALLKQARALEAQGPSRDGKLACLIDHVARCLNEGFSPIVFCHYISTAQYVEIALRRAFPAASTAVVTGDTGDAAARREAIIALSLRSPRVLIATDCISEGVNLQSYFDAVIHYDLSWNPMRMLQREGRVDRLGQQRGEVLCVTLHGPDNPIDVAMLAVLRRKASRIRSDLGVEVWLPQSNNVAAEQMMDELITHGAGALREDKNARAALTSAAARLGGSAAESQNDEPLKRHYAQTELRPDQVIPEWREALSALGCFEDVERFVTGALRRLQGTLNPLEPHLYRVQLDSLMAFARDRLDDEKVARVGTLRFAPPRQTHPDAVTRGHRLVTSLADLMVEQAAGKRNELRIGGMGCAGCWESPNVQSVTTVALLRIRYRLELGNKVQDVDEVSAVAWTGSQGNAVLAHEKALALLSLPASADVAPEAKTRQLRRALTLLDAQRANLDGYARQRADKLLADHRRMRSASRQDVTCSVSYLQPLDVHGIYVLLPKVS